MSVLLFLSLTFHCYHSAVLQLCFQNKLPPDFIFPLLEEGPVCVLLHNLLFQLSFPTGGITQLIIIQLLKPHSNFSLSWPDMLHILIGSWVLAVLVTADSWRQELLREWSLCSSAACSLRTFFQTDRTAAVPHFCHEFVSKASRSHSDMNASFCVRFLVSSLWTED